MTSRGSNYRECFDWYKKENIDALVRPDVPAIVGVSSSNVGYVNLGKIDVKGWELNLSWRDKIGNVNYNLGLYNAVL